MEKQREQAQEKHEPVEQSVQIDCPIEEAFRLFTECFAEWWPFAEDLELEPWLGGRLLETSSRRQEAELGTIFVWDPPRRLAFTWNPGQPHDSDPDDSDQTVSVEFLVVADGTRITLTHEGWHRSGVETSMARFAAFACDRLFAMA